MNIHIFAGSQMQMPLENFACLKEDAEFKTLYITSWQIDGQTIETVADFIFWAPKSLQMVSAAMKLKEACSLEEKL